MKEEWLKDIHEQMSDYQIDEPNGLWESIQAKRSEENKKRRYAAASLWTKRFAATAAAIILLFFVSQFFTEKENSSTPVITNLSSERINDKNHDLPESSPVKNIENTIITNNENQKKSKEKVILTEKTNQSQTKIITNVAKISSVDKILTKEEFIIKNPLKIVQEQKIYLPKLENEDFLPEEVVQVDIRENRNPFYFGVFTSGGKGTSLNSKSVSEPNIYAVGSDQSDWKESSLLGTLAFNKGKEIKTNVEHRLPVQTGLLFAYKITNRIGVESGITYTILTSDIREGSENHYFISEQRLRYIGFPLHLKYRAFSWKGFELYSSTGILTEKNISGTLNKSYFLDNQLTQTENKTFKVKAWQWSVNAAVGIQYNFSPWLGFYAEPGVSYYFDNNSQVETIYKNKPFNFNLNLGLRFSFGK